MNKYEHEEWCLEKAYGEVFNDTKQLNFNVQTGEMTTKGGFFLRAMVEGFTPYFTLDGVYFGYRAGSHGFCQVIDSQQWSYMDTYWELKSYY